MSNSTNRPIIRGEGNDAKNASMKSGNIPVVLPDLVPDSLALYFCCVEVDAVAKIHESDCRSGSCLCFDFSLTRCDPAQVANFLWSSKPFRTPTSQ